MTYTIKRLFIPLTLCRTFIAKSIINPPIQKFNCSFCRNKYSTFTLTSKTNTSISITPIFSTFSRLKSAKNEEESDDESEFKDNDASLSRDSKIVNFQTTSMRTDLILKSALGIARNKIEKSFYESKIRVNGKKLLKKSVAVKIGDEVDLIRTVSASNPDHLHVARVEILKITPKEEDIKVTVRRFKNLLIENYEVDPYKGSANSET